MMHDQPMRHRKPLTTTTTGTTNCGARPICHALLDLMNEFMTSHTTRNYVANCDLFQLVVGIIHRVVCFQKRCQVRIEYQWKPLWLSLISLIKYITQNESYLFKQECNIFQLAYQVVNVFNLFILHGDTFLLCPTYYDQLYYEIVRMHTVFSNLNSLSKYTRLIVWLPFEQQFGPIKS